MSVDSSAMPLAAVMCAKSHIFSSMVISAAIRHCRGAHSETDVAPLRMELPPSSSITTFFANLFSTMHEKIKKQRVDELNGSVVFGSADSAPEGV